MEPFNILQDTWGHFYPHLSFQKKHRGLVNVEISMFRYVVTVALKVVIYAALCYLVEVGLRVYVMPAVPSYLESVKELRNNAIVKEYFEFEMGGAQQFSIYKRAAWGTFESVMKDSEAGLGAYGGATVLQMVGETGTGVAEFFSSPFRCERVILGFALVWLL